MTELTNDFAIAQTLALLTRYAFDLRGDDGARLITEWLKSYQANWIRLATIEALYLGRYKAVSVEQILAVWTRLDNPNYHFNHEFERLICRKLPRHLAEISEFSKVNSQRGNWLVLGEREASPTISMTRNNREQLELEVRSSRHADSCDSSDLIKESQQVTLPEIPNLSRSQDKLSSQEEYLASPSNSASSDRSFSSRRLNYPTPIQEFTPTHDGSEFYLKLKAVAKQSLEEEFENQDFPSER